MIATLDVIYDMETSDPDDAMTLCLLAGHSKVNLRAVTVTPGSPDQVNLIKYILRFFDKEELPVGVRTPGYSKSAVSQFHYTWLGNNDKWKVKTDCNLPAVKVLQETFTYFPECVLLTGAAVSNLRALLEQYPELQLSRWVAQGGFAGDEVVPPEFRLTKFAGRNTCPTFNFNGDVPGAKLALSTLNIKLRQLVSKNVCHGVVYDQSLHERIQPFQAKHLGLSMIYCGMTEYLKKHPNGKMFHDPLAACTLIDPSICEFREVEVYREKGEWGSRLKSKTNTFISIMADSEKFFHTLIDYSN